MLEAWAAAEPGTPDQKEISSNMFFRKKQKSRAEVEKQVRALGWWYQHFELPSGVFTGIGKDPAYRPETRWKLLEPYVPQDLSGQTVLDVGGNAGFFSIQMKLRGAKRCVLVEPYVEFVRQAEYVAGEFDVKLEIVNDDVHTYCLTTEERFDYVIFLGLFYHLKYPVLVLDRLAEMTKRRIFFHSHVVGKEGSTYDDRANYARGTDDALIDDPVFPRMMFIEKLYNSDPTNWWIPNHTALEPLLRSAGLKVVARPHSQLNCCGTGRVLWESDLQEIGFPTVRQARWPTASRTSESAPRLVAGVIG